MTPRRWPNWIYGGGEEPDVRFSLANERTFLAWIRTALALLAAGVALDTLGAAAASQAEEVLTVLLVVLGLACAVASWWRWARTERSLRRGEPLPSPRLAAVLAGGVAIVAVVLLATR